MTNNLPQPDPNYHKEVTSQTEDAHACQTTAVSATLQLAPSPLIIWTPRFIITFFLVLVVGLSVASILTRGWINGYYPADGVRLACTLVNLGGWISVSICTRSPWVRSGGLFGCLWAILMGLTFFPIAHGTLVQIQATVAANAALLGSFLCLSIARTPLEDWDRTFFLLAPIVGAITAIILFLLDRGAVHSSFLLEECIATVELWTCTAIWWSRLSCWKTQPGPTFLLGIAPIIQLTLMQPVDNVTENTVFFSLVMLLSILLGTLRILQCELRRRLL